MADDLKKEIKIIVTKDGVEQAASSVHLTTEELKKLGVVVKDTARQTENSTNSMGESFQKIGAWIAAAFGINAIKNFLSTTTMAAAKFEEISDAFKGSANDMELFRAAVKGTVDDMGLMRLSNQASALGVELRDQPLIFALARKAAEAYGTGTEEGFQKVVMATEGNVRGLKAIGIQRKAYEEIVKSLAKAHGGLITEMDAETQKEIRMQAIIKVTGMTMEEATRINKTHASSIESAAAKWENLKLTIGEGLTPFFSSIFDWVGKIIDRIGVLAGNIKVLGQANRDDAYSASFSSWNKDEKTGKITGITQDQLNAEKDAMLKNIRDIKNMSQINDALMTNLAGSGSSKEIEDKLDAGRTAREAYKIQLKDFQSKLAILNAYKVVPDKKEETGGLTPEALQARLEKNQAIINKYNAAMLENGKIDLDKQIKASDKAIDDEYNELKDGAKKDVNLAAWKAVEQKKITEKFYSDQLKQIELQAETGKLSDSTKNAALITEKEQLEVLLKKQLPLETELAIKTKLKAVDDEIKNIDKAKLEFDQKYISQQLQFDKDTYEKKIASYTLSVEDYKKYLALLLDLDIQKLKDENKAIEDYNKKNPTSPKVLLNTGIYRAQKESDNQKILTDYSVRQPKEIADEFKRTHEVAGAVIDSIEAGTNSMWNSFLMNTHTATNAWDAAWQQMENTAIQKLMAIIENEAWNAIIGLFAGAIPGGGVLGNIFKMFTGGESSIDSNNPTDFFQSNSAIKAPLNLHVPQLMKVRVEGTLRQHGLEMRAVLNQTDNYIGDKR